MNMHFPSQVNRNTKEAASRIINRNAFLREAGRLHKALIAEGRRKTKT